MSVPVYKRKLSKLQVHEESYRFEVDAIKFVMNERRVPKRYRPVLGFPLIELTRQMRGMLIIANSIYPTDQHEANIRRDYQTKAIGYIYWIANQIHLMMDVIQTNKDPYQPLTQRLLKVLDLTKKWRKSDTARYKDKFPTYNPTEERDEAMLKEVDEEIAKLEFSSADSTSQIGSPLVWEVK